MKRTEVKFTVKPGGEIKMDVLNGEGESCTLATREIELSLAKAGTKKDEGKKPEFYEGESGISVFNNLG